MSDYTPQPQRFGDYYPESYARFQDVLSDGIVPDWDDEDHDRNEAQFRADLAAHDAQVAAQALREAADALDAYQGDVPDDPRWTCDLGYYGEAQWLCDRADQITKENR